MSDFPALMKAVLADPRDDLPRLVLADWLDENGQGERADFIRTQVQLAELRAMKGRPTGGMALLGFKAAMHQNEAVFAAIMGEACKCEMCLDRREELLMRCHIREWLEGTVPGAVMSSISFHMPVPYFLLPATAAEEIHSVNVEVSRGFVSGIICTREIWTGGDCQECRGLRRVLTALSPGSPYLTSVDCPRCDGKGSTEGIGRQLVAMHPIETVTLTGVVERSSVSEFGRVLRANAGPLYDLGFPNTHGHIEGPADVLDRRISAAAIAWASSPTG